MVMVLLLTSMLGRGRHQDPGRWNPNSRKGTQMSGRQVRTVSNGVPSAVGSHTPSTVDERNKRVVHPSEKYKDDHDVDHTDGAAHAGDVDADVDAKLQ